jgi:hypothetical protein
MVDPGTAFGTEGANDGSAAVRRARERLETPGQQLEGVLAHDETHAERATGLPLAFLAVTYTDRDDRVAVHSIAYGAALATAITGIAHDLDPPHRKTERVDIVAAPTDVPLLRPYVWPATPASSGVRAAEACDSFNCIKT